jgi:hypothetical protein
MHNNTYHNKKVRQLHLYNKVFNENEILYVLLMELDGVSMVKKIACVGRWYCWWIMLIV